jgi:hypothetical protein
MITKKYRYFEGKSVYCVRGVVSPMLANLFLHQVLDDWCVTDVQPRMQGRCFLMRFADGTPVQGVRLMG